jgi:hypothetical protein
MSVPARPRASAPFGRRCALCLICLAGLLTGCAGAPSVPVAAPHPADPASPARPAAYRSVVGGYASERPRDPADWRDSNERVAPQAKP